MSCDCKKKMILEDKYGEKVDETVFDKTLRFCWSLMMFSIAILLAVVIVPVMVVIIIYKLAFKDDTNIILPNFLGKYLKDSNNG